MYSIADRVDHSVTNAVCHAVAVAVATSQQAAILQSRRFGSFFRASTAGPFLGPALRADLWCPLWRTAGLPSRACTSERRGRRRTQLGRHARRPAHWLAHRCAARCRSVIGSNAADSRLGGPPAGRRPCFGRVLRLLAERGSDSVSRKLDMGQRCSDFIPGFWAREPYTRANLHAAELRVRKPRGLWPRTDDGLQSFLCCHTS